MSLIQEALRRQQEEERMTNRGAAEGAAGQPPAPPSGSLSLSLKKTMYEAGAGDAADAPRSRPAAAPPHPERSAAATESLDGGTGQTVDEEKIATTNTVGGLAVVLVIILLLLAGLLWGGYYAYTMWQASGERRARAEVEDGRATGMPEITSTDSVGSATAEAPRNEPADFTEVTSEPEKSDSPPAEEDRTPEDRLVTGDVSRTSEPGTGTGPNQTGKSGATPGTETAGTTAPPAPAASPGSAAVVWPSINVDGFMGSASGGTALLNGEMVPVGQRVNGVELVAIRSGYVWLKYEGKLKRLRKGQSTTD